MSQLSRMSLYRSSWSSNPFSTSLNTLRSLSRTFFLLEMSSPRNCSRLSSSSSSSDAEPPPPPDRGRSRVREAKSSSPAMLYFRRLRRGRSPRRQELPPVWRVIPVGWVLLVDNRRLHQTCKRLNPLHQDPVGSLDWLVGEKPALCNLS